MGKKRKLEIENPTKFFSFREKIQGLDNYDGQDLFSFKEAEEDYRIDDFFIWVKKSSSN